MTVSFTFHVVLLGFALLCDDAASYRVAESIVESITSGTEQDNTLQQKLLHRSSKALSNDASTSLDTGLSGKSYGSCMFIRQGQAISQRPDHYQSIGYSANLHASKENYYACASWNLHIQCALQVRREEQCRLPSDQVFNVISRALVPAYGELQYPSASRLYSSKKPVVVDGKEQVAVFKPKSITPDSRNGELPQTCTIHCECMTSLINLGRGLHTKVHSIEAADITEHHGECEGPDDWWFFGLETPET